MITDNVSNCPICGGALKYYDKVSRIIRSEGGRIARINIRRLRCLICKRLHRELPAFIFPYKHYRADIIQGVLSGSITIDALEYEDYPCEMTIKRWTRK